MNKIPVKERILNTAEKLFYEQGYRATGINQIIKEAEVAKASFYHYFPSKESLCVQYLKQKSDKARKRHKMFMESGGDTPCDRVCGLFENIRYTASANNFNGRPFLNISSEINEYDNAIRREVTEHKSSLIKRIADELKGYKQNNILAEMIYVVYEGANIGVKNYRDTWPVDRGVKVVKQPPQEAEHE